MWGRCFRQRIRALKCWIWLTHRYMGHETGQVGCVHAQSCLTLGDPMDCSLSGSSVLGISQQEYWSGLSHPPLRDLPTQGSNLCFLHWQADSLPLSHLGNPGIWGFSKLQPCGADCEGPCMYG